jgi:glycosyltransferase involved in cell wall biosynthesis
MSESDGQDSDVLRGRPATDTLPGNLLVLYEASVHRAGLGGARFHFVGLAAALFTHLGTSLRLVAPRFRAVASLRDSLPSGIDIVELRCGRRGITGFLLYELQKALFYMRISAQSPSRRVILLTRLSYHGVSTVIARALGWRVLLEANGVPWLEAADRRLSVPMRWFISLASRLQTACAHELISVTPGIANEMGRSRRARVHVIPNGADLRSFPALPEELAESRRSIIFVGTLAPWQDVSLLLRALGLLVKEDEGEGPSWVLSIVGDGEQAEELHALADTLGVMGHVRFTGWQPHEAISALIGRAWICAVPLRRKAGLSSCGSPLKLFEYLASNRPVVASNIDGVRELELPLIERYEEADLSSLTAALRRASALSALSPAMIEKLRTSISWKSRADRILQVALHPGSHVTARQGGSALRE